MGGHGNDWPFGWVSGQVPVLIDGVMDRGMYFPNNKSA